MQMKFLRRLERFKVKRKLATVCIAYLAGIGLAREFQAAWGTSFAVCALFAGLGLRCRVRKRSAFLYVVMLSLALGWARTSHVLCTGDEATEPGVRIEGTVFRKVTEQRVYLSEVKVENERVLRRPVLVTLMLEDGEEAQSVQIGQTILGTGRLFEQDDVRNPGGIDWRIWALCEGYDLSGYILSGWSVEGTACFSLREFFRQINEALCERAEALFGQQAAFFQAILIGSDAQLEDELLQSMRISGIAHILVVSGMHLSLIALAVRRIMKRLGIGRRVRFCCLSVLVSAFCLLTGGAAGTVRASIMVLLRELAPMTGRRYDPITALAAAALIMTAVNPVWALSASFQFSFFVVLGILLLGSGIASRQGKRRGGIRSTLAINLSAQFAAWPMQMLLYGYIPLLSIPMNLLCGLLMPVLLLGGWSAMLLSGLSMPLGQGVAAVVRLPAEALETISLSVAEGGILRVPAPYGVALIIQGLLMAVLSPKIHVRFSRKRLAGMLCALLICGYLPRLNGAVRYVQLDVGQGDAALLRRGRSAVLIDVGPADDYAMLRYLRHEGLNVDAVILTHLDEDHAGALHVLLDSEVRIDRIILAEGAEDTEGSAVVTEALDTARDRNIVIEHVSAGAEITASGFAFRVLSPDGTLKGSNERSLVLEADVEGMRLLTLGDLPADCEMEDVPDCDILKVAHHGSKYATSTALIREATPQIAIISVGNNSYGHPSQRVLDDLYAVGARVYRTDESGCVTIWTGTATVIPFRP